MKTKHLLPFAAAFCGWFAAQSSFGQSTALTYQGRLNDGAGPANGSYDLQFTVYDSTNLPGTVIAGPVTNSATGVSNGLFTVTLDFGVGVFTGPDRWLEIGVRANGGGGFATLSPRQKLTPAPYAIMAGSAGTLANGGQTGFRVQSLPSGPSYSNVVDVAGGSPINIASGVAATVSGGGAVINCFAARNEVIADFGTISGGAWNFVTSGFGTIAGGYNNTASGIQFATVGGGDQNTASGYYTTVSGGQQNAASGTNSTVSGGAGNTASGTGSFIGGGGTDGVTISGNTASGVASVVSGGIGNSSSGDYTTVGGGSQNGATTYGSTIGGGFNNQAISGAQYATVGGGQLNSVTGNYGTISGGNQNSTVDYATVGGGFKNVSSGHAATVPGGADNTAAGSWSFAAGLFAKANHAGSFVWADSQGGNFASATNDTFNIRAVNGVQLAPNTSMNFGTQVRQMLNLWGTQYGIGVQSYTLYFRTDNSFPGGGFAWYQGGTHSDAETNAGGGTTMMTLDNTGLRVNGTFVSASDRNLKQDFAEVDSGTVLEKVAQLPIQTWAYKNDPGTKHLGPVAQDFYAAFNVGPDDRHITTVDESGVALAAIQGLNQKLEEQRAENAELKRRLEALEKMMRERGSK